MINHKSSIPIKSGSIINRQSQSAFTLIELLIVVIIIGTLATILFANYMGVRQRARDSRRKSDLRQIQAALELYRYNQGIYPTSLKNCPIGTPTYFGDPTCTVTYMQKIPTDPKGTSYYINGNYRYGGNGTVYILCACLENTNDSQGADYFSCRSAAFPSCSAATGGSGKFFYLVDQ